MKGLLLKDFYVLLKQMKIFLVIIPVMALFGGMSLAAFAIIMGSLLPMTAIAYDERSKWDELAAMMPFSKNDIVLSKYLLGYLAIFSTTSLVIIGSIVSKIANFSDQGVQTNVILFSLLGSLIFIAINNPILLRFGSEKGRFVYIIGMAIIGGLGGALNSIDAEIMTKIASIPPIIFLFIAVLLNLISIKVSISICKKKR